MELRPDHFPAPYFPFSILFNPGLFFRKEDGQWAGTVYPSTS
jgi:hypothetical protein